MNQPEAKEASDAAPQPVRKDELEPLSHEAQKV